MSHEDVLRALMQLLLNQFKEPPEVAPEFAGAVAPAEDAHRTIAGRLLERVLTNEDLDVGFSMDRETAAQGGTRAAAPTRAAWAERAAAPRARK
jgi:hypothetical protein